MNTLIILNDSKETLTASGVSMGTAIFTSLAVVCSWTRNRSVFWAFVAGVFNIFYVIYWLMTRTEEEQRKKK
ncbi:hypothetical protein [Nonlabens sp. SY33080]|uniref:hypothetical protein n=1 Tax=Nonlabens sp. SY33080 TaxID=2719911 RepID=UPI001428C3C2|nr:hypothetical protein [Nonlabens sp. SY33080]